MEELPSSLGRVGAAVAKKKGKARSSMSGAQNEKFGGVNNIISGCLKIKYARAATNNWLISYLCCNFHNRRVYVTKFKR